VFQLHPSRINNSDKICETGRESVVATGSINDLLWIVAVLSGWLAIICLLGGWYAGAKFQTLLKAPLSEEVEHLTHVWERRVDRWTALGLSMAGLSILCIIGWLVADKFVQ
jgi:hypothetical protein